MPRDDNLAIIIITQLYIRYVLGRFGPFRNLDFQCFAYQIKGIFCYYLLIYAFPRINAEVKTVCEKVSFLHSFQSAIMSSDKVFDTRTF